MSWDHNQYNARNKTTTDGDLRTFTLLFYVVLFLVLYWWWSQDIYFTVLCCFILLFYTDGDLRTFTLLFYVVLFVVLYWWWSQDIYFTVLCCFISWFILMAISGHFLYCFMLFYFLFYTDGDLRTFTLLFYVILFLGLNWWWSQDIYFTVLCCFTSCFILMVISVHLLYCFMLFYFLFYTDGDLRTFISIKQEIKQIKK